MIYYILNINNSASLRLQGIVMEIGILIRLIKSFMFFCDKHAIQDFNLINLNTLYATYSQVTEQDLSQGQDSSPDSALPIT